jgi:hypothetical protein
MKSPPLKVHWLERAISIYNFHSSQLKDEPDWTIEKTAAALNRSLGSVSQDITIASWSVNYGKQLRRCSSMRDALAYIKDKKREMKLMEIER